MIYENIVRLCGERGIAIRRLEKQIGLGNGAIAKWKTSSPNVESLKRVADHFRVSLDALVSGEAGECGTEFRKGEFCFRSRGKDLFGGSFKNAAELTELLARYAGQADVKVVITAEE